MNDDQVILRKIFSVVLCAMHSTTATIVCGFYHNLDALGSLIGKGVPVKVSEPAASFKGCFRLFSRHAARPMSCPLLHKLAPTSHRSIVRRCRTEVDDDNNE